MRAGKSAPLAVAASRCAASRIAALLDAKRATLERVGPRGRSVKIIAE